MGSALDSDGVNALSLKRAPRQKLTETVAQQLLAAISELEPGARVPSERELTRDLGVGRSTVREALNGLALLGVVEIRHGQGVFVVDRKDEDGGPDALQRALMKGLTQEFLEARLVVEVEIVGLAAQRRTDADLQHILDTIQQLEQARGAPVELALEPATQFNVAVAEAAHNEVLAAVEESFVGLMIERASELYDSDEFREWDIAEHRRILEAIRDGDSDLAKRRMRDHIVAIGEHYKRVGKI
ncbi:MAG: FadR/GntR family transcriptional regulator [Solirubrobacteraceae bacterium]|jgi:GntR family transcriptional repressor for pyruvate dehydrogenase complex